MSKIKKVYAYYIVDTYEKGIVYEWESCQSIIKGKKVRYKSFKSEIEAKNWLDLGANYENKNNRNIEGLSKLDRNAVYFDAGTGRGNGVEVRVTDYNGNSLLYSILNENKINDYGNYYLSQGRTNNYGELVGLFAALKYSIKYGNRIICGDSNLVIEYWSLGKFNSKNLDDDTIKLIEKVKILRKEYENIGGILKKISGDINPADLGFHK